MNFFLIKIEQKSKINSVVLNLNVHVVNQVVGEVQYEENPIKLFLNEFQNSI